MTNHQCKTCKVVFKSNKAYAKHIESDDPPCRKPKKSQTKAESSKIQQSKSIVSEEGVESKQSSRQSSKNITKDIITSAINLGKCNIINEIDSIGRTDIKEAPKTETDALVETIGIDEDHKVIVKHDVRNTTEIMSFPYTSDVTLDDLKHIRHIKEDKLIPEMTRLMYYNDSKPWCLNADDTLYSKGIIKVYRNSKWYNEDKDKIMRIMASKAMELLIEISEAVDIPVVNHFLMKKDAMETVNDHIAERLDEIRMQTLEQINSCLMAASIENSKNKTDDESTSDESEDDGKQLRRKQKSKKKK